MNVEQHYSMTELGPHLIRELRSDHAGETGAVWIYRGISSVARWRGNADLLNLARLHGQTEAEHLCLIESWLPRSQRSWLLYPWRAAGWLTGVLPALAGSSAVFATIAAVETFVDKHYQAQIDHIKAHGGPEGLLQVIERCQADEVHHRDEAIATLGHNTSSLLRAWCTVVSVGSDVAVRLARRI